MSWYFKAGLSAVVVACALLLVPTSVLARYPYDNGHHYGQLSNPGHHYGQLKHHKTPPVTPPSPGPKPKPNPGPVGTLAHHNLGSGAQPTTGESSWIPDFSLLLPAPTALSDQVQFGDWARGSDQDWLLLVILPALLAVWLWVFARAARSASRRRRQSPA